MFEKELISSMQTAAGLLYFLITYSYAEPKYNTKHLNDMYKYDDDDEVRPKD